MFEKIRKKLKSKKVKIGIFGLGYVGLPLALRFAEKNFKVYGFDNDKKKILKLKKGISYIRQIPDSVLKKLVGKKLIVNSNFSKVSNIDVLIFCLPTPVRKNKSPNLSFLKNCLNKIKKNIKKGQIFCHESTSYPGTTEKYFETIFNKRKLVIGEDCYLIFSPEREDPGNNLFKIKNITKVVSGKTDKCLTLGAILYKSVVNKVFKVKDIKTAEMTKLVENIFRSVNIGLINEMKIICDKMGIDIWDVVEAAKSKPFGFYPFSPGPGVGGHCIPIDPFILTWEAKKYDANTEFIRLAAKINEYMPSYVVKKTYKSLSALSKNKKLKKNYKILLVGVAYKPNVDDYREAPALEIINILTQKYKYQVSYCDPLVPILHTKKLIHKNKYKTIKLNYKLFKNFDAVLLLQTMTYLIIKIITHSNLIIDTRGVYKRIKSKKIINA